MSNGKLFIGLVIIAGLVLAGINTGKPTGQVIETPTLSCTMDPALVYPTRILIMPSTSVINEWHIATKESPLIIQAQSDLKTQVNMFYYGTPVYPLEDKVVGDIHNKKWLLKYNEVEYTMTRSSLGGPITIKTFRLGCSEALGTEYIKADK